MCASLIPLAILTGEEQERFTNTNNYNNENIIISSLLYLGKYIYYKTFKKQILHKVTDPILLGKFHAHISRRNQNYLAV